MKKLIPLLLFIFVLNIVGIAQTNGDWNGKKCAVVLTYDDALNVHLNNAIPALDSLGLKGTFYLSGTVEAIQSQSARWKLAAEGGHELGNHTLKHPCAGGRPGREWVKPETDMNNYTVPQIEKEIRDLNDLLKKIDGKSERTFAYPCGDSKIGDSFYIDGLKPELAGARSVFPAMPTIGKIDLFNIPSYVINGQSGKEMISLVNQAIEKGGLLVFLFHGVGGEHNLNVSLSAHHELVRFLKDHESEIWNAPLVDVARYIQSKQN